MHLCPLLFTGKGLIFCAFVNKLESMIMHCHDYFVMKSSIYLSCSGIKLNFASDFSVRKIGVEQSLDSCINQSY